jgi:aspartyl-tRNA(Asn)/glutamyl-tRNA(Gln) amidotransferase subunit C
VDARLKAEQGNFSSRPWTLEEGSVKRCRSTIPRCGMVHPMISSPAFREGPAMSIDRKTVRRIARLARIKVSDDDLPRLEGELNSILKWIEMLNEVDTTDVDPMTSVVKISMKMRDDVVTEGADPAQVTANAPRTEDGFYVVPKVIE